MSGWLPGLVQGVLGVLGVAMLLTLYRLVRGPSLPDRVMALDVIALQATGATTAWAIHTGETFLLDVALVLAIISSLGTIVIARYLVKGSEEGHVAPEDGR